MNIALIAAVGSNYEIGKDNKLVCPIKEDLKYFKNLTIYHTVLMGRKTYESIGGPLPNRKNIVLTRNNIKEVSTFKSKEEFIKEYKDKDENVFVIGGESVYKMFLEEADKIYLTEIDKTFDADTYFPKFNKENYEKEVISSLKDNEINYKHVLYRRKK